LHGCVGDGAGRPRDVHPYVRGERERRRITIMRKHYLAVMLAGAVALAPLSYVHAQTQPVSPARAAAVHECSVQAQRYPETTFSSLEVELYRACMAQHGQVE
jgi:hypothetical protein